MSRSRTLAAGLALTLCAGGALAMGSRKKKKEPVRREAPPAADPMDEGRARVKMAEAAAEAGKDELAQRTFAQAAERFLAATQATPDDPEAWNQLGYSRRRSGDLRGALQAYTTALDLRPGYAEAIEYQAEAYLGLEMYDRVTAAHQTLVQAGDQEAASTLLAACKAHVAARKAAGASGSVFGEFAAWVRRRDGLAEKMERPTGEGKRW